jgi:hypothetical protein
MSASALQPADDQRVGAVEALALLGVIGIASFGAASLLLAQQGSFETPAALALGTAVLGVVLLGAFLAGGVPDIAVSRRSAVAAAGVVALTAFAFLPGFPYFFGDKDPGVYVVHAYGIERTGSTDIVDHVATTAHRDAEAEIGPYNGESGRYPGLRIVGEREGELVTSTDFFNFVPSLLALAVGLGGTAAVFNITPVIAGLSVLIVGAAVRRALGAAAAAVTAVLLATNMMQVWQAKTPSTEIPMQAVSWGVVLAVMVAIRTGWAGAAFLAGFLTGVAFLIRPDGFLVVLMAAGLVGLVLATSRADRRLVAGAVGATCSLPYAFVNAYVVEGDYVAANNVPPAIALAGAAAGVVVAGGVLGRLRGTAATTTRLGHRLGAFPARRAGAVLVALTIAVGVLAWNREAWFGITMGEFNNEPIRTYDERNLRWLSYFFSVPGLLLAVAGLAVLSVRSRWRATDWILVAPGLAVLPIYLYEAMISPRMMWWVRRFVPLVVPTLVVLIAVALVWALTRPAKPMVITGAVATVALVASFVGQAWPLRAHREFAGSWDVAADMAAATEDAGVVLVVRPGPEGIVGAARNVPSAAWLGFGTPTTYLPPGDDVDEQAFVDDWAGAVEGPVFLVSETEAVPDDLDPADWQLQERIRRGLPIWEETNHRRPERPRVAVQEMWIWRYRPVSAATGR